MTRILAFVALISILWLLPAAAQQGRGLADALELMRAEQWDAAARRAGRDGPVARDVIEWHRLRRGLGTAADVTAFLVRHPDWPGLPLLRRKSEGAIAAAGAGAVLEFYSEDPPQTAAGALSLAQTLIAIGGRGDGEAGLVLAWRTLPMNSSLQAAYLKDFSKLLKPHHVARLDRLLWDKNLTSAKRMLNLVPKPERRLAEARIALQDRTAGVDAKIEAVPGRLRRSAGLAYDRFVWRDRKKRQEDAITLMLERSSAAAALGEPAKWARRRRDLARQDMRDGNYKRAYKLASRHFTTPEAGYNYSDLEWLSGYIALRKLNDPATATRHFQHFLDSVETPISKGRGGYWLGRAYAASGQADKAHEAYAIGAQFQSSFYGLLAAEKIGRPFDPALRDPPALPDWRKADYLNSSSVAKAALMLISAEETALATRFLTHLVEGLDVVQARQLGQMAVDMNQPYLAVMISKRAARQGLELQGAYFPLHPVAKQRLPMAKEMTLAIARRESEFNHIVISGAGARGLMQVMPATAKLVARDLGILTNHSTARLTDGWKYNAKLGTNYLAGLAAEFNGNVVMMAAGYNAGPRRPITWMKRYGDPRDGTPNIVDWIEHIPFNETRNYVMRITESLPVYRARLGQEPLPIPFSRELAGSTLRAFAP